MYQKSRFLFLGDYLLVGCEQPIVRIYDVHTGQCFVGQSFMSQHQDIITGVQWSADGKLYVSASADGNIKVSMLELNLIVTQIIRIF